MARQSRQEPKGVLVFDPKFDLIAITKNINTAAKLTGSYAVSVWLNVKGDLISTNNLYFRVIPDDIEVDLSDFNSLKLQDFDKLCGLERTYVVPDLLLKRTKRFNKSNSK